MQKNEQQIKAMLYSADSPSEEQKQRLLAFVHKKHGENIELEWVEDSAIHGGFRLKVGSKIYDWSTEGRFLQFKNSLTKSSTLTENIIPLLRKSVENWVPEAIAEERGTVTSVGDGIAKVDGLDNATYGEILIFDSGIRGMVQNLNEDGVGCILFGDDEDISEGSIVRRTGKTAGMPVGHAFLGRVVNALGNAIDGKGDIEPEAYYAIEKAAPSIIDRQPVDKPLETGILAIDSMFPIGRGQRELIIGDRQTGKTAIAIDTIINQKNKDVICIYVAIGQKASSVAQLAENLRKHGAMDYTIIVNASAGEPDPFVYLAPYSGCAMAEFFMDEGKDVLIVYDDLSKHAVAYRALSLLLERAPGREAYPGDVFYLHSRLLERSAHLSAENGGGSMTALPIAETQGGDVSAYIPTNIISITDGQIFLESDLFFAGQRPAINVGLSVSRVGSAAQTKAMKKSSGTLRLELAQYREMEVFTQFASDLDDSMRKTLNYGAGLMQMLRQPQYSPLDTSKQVVILAAALNKVFLDVPINKLKLFISDMLKYFDEHYDAVCKHIELSGELSDDDREKIVEVAREFAESYQW